MLKELELVTPRVEYARLMFRWTRQPSFKRFSDGRPSLAKTKKRVMQEAHSLKSRDKYPSRRWFIKLGDEIAGTVSVHRMSRVSGTAEVGALIAEEFQGRGVGGRALRMLVKKVFAETKLRKLLAYVNEKNLASRRMAERLGFRQEGLLRKQQLLRGKPVNEVVYGLLRQEFRA